MKLIISSSFTHRALFFALLTIHTAPPSCECFTMNTNSRASYSSRIHRNNDNNHHLSSTIMSASIEEDISFINNKSPSRIRRLSRRMGITRGEPKNGQINKKANGKQMKFVGTKRVSTVPVATNSSAGHTTLVQCMNEFFMDESKRNLLFPSNNAETLDMTQVSDELLQRWSKEAHLGGGEGPTTTSRNTMDGTNNSDRNDTPTTKQAVFKIDALLQMPGLKIISRSTIGMKLLLFEHNYPEYQFTLLDSNIFPQESSTPSPVIWLFNKLTQYRDTTSSFTRVRIVDDDQEENGTNHISFITDARLETRMHLPQRLLNILPNVNIGNFERQGSDAVQKLLEKELEPALNAFCDTFCIFMETKLKSIEERKKEEKIEDTTVALRPQF